jgi:hypothetical protein
VIEMDKANARLSWNLFLDCPYCKKLIDMADDIEDDGGWISRPIFENRWEDLEDEVFDCPYCEKEITIGKIEY